MEELKMLDEVIKDRLERADSLEPGTKEREVFDHGTAEFIQRRNDLYKTLCDSDSAAEQHELETAKLEEEKKNRWTSVVKWAAGGVGMTVVFLYSQVLDQVFSETGTTTSVFGKAVLQQLAKPFKKK